MEYMSIGSYVTAKMLFLKKAFLLLYHRYQIMQISVISLSLPSVALQGVNSHGPPQLTPGNTFFFF